MKFRIHSALREHAGQRRVQEWDLALRDLNHEAGEDPRFLTLYGGDEGVQLVLSGQGTGIQVIELSRETLAPHLKAYADIIQRMAASVRGEDSARSMETLDYAKKLIHDEAGELIMERTEGHVELDLATGRRLFTLIFLISSQLPEALVTFHRAHR